MMGKGGIVRVLQNLLIPPSYQNGFDSSTDCGFTTALGQVPKYRQECILQGRVGFITIAPNALSQHVHR